MIATDLWTDAWLDSMRLECDPAADAVVQSLYERGQVPLVNELLDLLVHNRQPPPSALPVEVREYLHATAALPPWADPARIRLGESTFRRYGVLSLASLLCASLLECYVMRNGVHVLSLTTLLHKHTRRRLYETAQMVVRVMDRGGLDDNGAGIRTAQKVRLLHAAMRRLLEEDPTAATEALQGKRSMGALFARQRWNPAWGRPICQEDMAFTLLSFSFLVLRSLQRLGAPLDERERDAYLHCWRVTGYILGVREELLPATLADAEVLYERIYRRQKGGTPEGRELAERLITTVADTLVEPLRYAARSVDARLPRAARWLLRPLASDRSEAEVLAFARDFTVAVARHLLPPDAADMLGLEAASLPMSVSLKGTVVVLRAFFELPERFNDRFPAVHEALTAVGGRWVERLTRIDPDWHKSLFDLPPSLVAEWRAEADAGVT